MELDMSEDECKQCLRAHGASHGSSSNDNDSGLDDLDEVHKAFKPPPVDIDPRRDKITNITHSENDVRVKPLPTGKRFKTISNKNIKTVVVEDKNTRETSMKTFINNKKKSHQLMKNQRKLRKNEKLHNISPDYENKLALNSNSKTNREMKYLTEINDNSHQSGNNSNLEALNVDNCNNKSSKTSETQSFLTKHNEEKITKTKRITTSPELKIDEIKSTRVSPKLKNIKKKLDITRKNEEILLQGASGKEKGVTAYEENLRCEDNRVELSSHYSTRKQDKFEKETQVISKVNKECKSSSITDKQLIDKAKITSHDEIIHNTDFTRNDNNSSANCKKAEKKMRSRKRKNKTKGSNEIENNKRESEDDNEKETLLGKNQKREMILQTKTVICNEKIDSNIKKGTNNDKTIFGVSNHGVSKKTKIKEGEMQFNIDNAPTPLNLGMFFCKENIVNKNRNQTSIFLKKLNDEAMIPKSNDDDNSRLGSSYADILKKNYIPEVSKSVYVNKNENKYSIQTTSCQLKHLPESGNVKTSPKRKIKNKAKKDSAERDSVVKQENCLQDFVLSKSQKRRLRRKVSKNNIKDETTTNNIARGNTIGIGKEAFNDLPFIFDVSLEIEDVIGFWDEPYMVDFSPNGEIVKLNMSHFIEPDNSPSIEDSTFLQSCLNVNFRRQVRFTIDELSHNFYLSRYVSNNYQSIKKCNVSCLEELPGNELCDISDDWAVIPLQNSNVANESIKFLGLPSEAVTMFIVMVVVYFFSRMVIIFILYLLLHCVDALFFIAVMLYLFLLFITRF